MSGGDTMSQLAVVILLLGLSVPGLMTAYDFAGTPIEYEQSATIDVNGETVVEEGATLENYGDEISVRASDGAELAPYRDYRWNETDGTVTWLNSSNTTDGESATITYEAHQRTVETETAWNILTPLFSLFGLFAFVASLRTLWSYLAEVFNR